jgi:cytochrome c5
MQHAATFLIVATAATLLACGKSEEIPAPAEPPAVAAPQAEPPALVAEAAPAMQPEASTAQPEVVPPAAASTPTPTKPAAPEPAVETAPAAEAAPAAPSPDLARGEQIYRQACAFCHDRGVAGAPKTGDVAAWSARLAQGMDTLYTVALRGKGAMPAKGGNRTLADADVNAAVDYMVAQSR